MEIFRRSAKKGLISNFGPAYQELVRAIHDITDTYCVPVNSGTAAIQIALMATLPRGCRVALPDFTHAGTLHAVTAAGMVPVLVPVDPKTWTISKAHLINYRDHYDAFIVVSPFGYWVDFIAYDLLSKNFKKPLVYDLAGAWGLRIVTDNPTCYSLHGTKNFSIGEGGLACFSTRDQQKLAQRFSNFGTLSDRSVMSPIGFNFKMDEIHCAMALAHLEKPKVMLQRIHHKSWSIGFYQSLLEDLCTAHSRHYGGAPSLCVLQGLPTNKIEHRCQEYGFVAKRYYPLLSEMKGLKCVKRLGVSPKVMKTCVALPSDATDREMRSVVRKIKSILAR